MHKKSFRFRYILFAAAVLIVVALQLTGVFGGLQNYIVEKRAEYSPRPASGQIVFVGIDKKSLDQVGVWPWPRSVYAKAIDRLVGHKVADIAFDVDFSTSSTAEEDNAFADALRASGGSVILPSFLQGSSADVTSSSVERSKPLDIFAREAWMAGVNVVPDSDGLIRTYPLGMEIGGEVTSSFSNLISGNGIVDTSSFNIDFSIQPSTIPSYSFADLISGKLPEEALKDKTVVVGAHALELRDNLAVPVHGVMTGPILQIVAAETLLQQRQLSFIGPVITILILILMCVCAASSSRKMRLQHKLLGLALLVLLIEVVGFYLQTVFAIVLISAPFLILAAISAIVVTGADFDIKSWLLRIAKLEVQNTKNLLDHVFADSSDAILIVDENGSAIEMNARFRELIGATEKSSTSGLLPEGTPKTFIDDAHSAIQQMKVGNGPETKLGHLVLINANNKVFVEYSVTPSRILELSENQRYEAEEHLVACVTARDVTMQTIQKHQLKWQSEHDFLTGSERRDEFILRLEKQVHDQTEPTASTQLLALGIHRFSAVNAMLGRDVGDGLLKAFVKRLEKMGPFVEGVSRLDGANFAVRLSPGQDGVENSGLPTKMLKEMSLPYQFDGQQISVDPCIGLAGIASDSTTAAELLEHAEFALEEAVSIGPQTIRVFDPALNEQQKKARQIEREMEHALNKGQFYLAYQPQVTVGDGAPSGAEALVRWDHPKLGAISPADFIEIAEANGIIEKIGRFALNQACRDAVSWPPNMTVAVNVSPLQFVRGDIVKDVQIALLMSGLAADRLELEITESSFLTSTDDLLMKMSALKKLGVALSLDDFGTGYSSLSYFNKYPLDKIKVDQAFVKDIESKPANQSIIQSVKVLADGLGIKLLCEGVETEDELRIVHELGCDQVQGFYFGKPQSLDDISVYFNRNLEAAA